MDLVEERLELEQNPVAEGGDDLHEVYAQIDNQKATLASKEREIEKLRTELDTYKYTV